MQYIVLMLRMARHYSETVLAPELSNSDSLRGMHPYMMQSAHCNLVLLRRLFHLWLFFCFFDVVSFWWFHIVVGYWMVLILAYFFSVLQNLRFSLLYRPRKFYTLWKLCKLFILSNCDAFVFFKLSVTS